MLADGALQFAFEKATTEGKITIMVLFVLSLFSWTIIITKFRQLQRARAGPKNSSPPMRRAATRSTSSGAAMFFGARPPTSSTSAGPMNWNIT